MPDFDQEITSANAPGYDGSARVLQARQAAMHALVNGEPDVAGTLGSTGANRGGTLDSAGATATAANQNGLMHQIW